MRGVAARDAAAQRSSITWATTRIQGAGFSFDAGARLARHGQTALVGSGRYFEDFTVGDVYRHPLGRTITATDNTWMTLLTQNTAPLHFDANYARQTAWGRPVVNSTFTLALVTGQSVGDVSQRVFANLGWDEVRLPAPVFEGDTIYSESTVLQARPSRSHPDTGLVEVRTVGYNQDGTVVISFRRSLLVFRRGHGPAENPKPVR